MGKIILIIIVVIAVIAAGGYYIFKGQYQTSPAVWRPSASEPLTSGQTLPPSVRQAPVAEENTVIYADSGYSPQVLSIKKGQTVVFKNQSSRSMWPASAMHPTHQVYGGTPLSRHCPDTAGSAFDACQGFSPGENWSFKFDKTGTWKYHDHLSPKDTGSIRVE